MSVTVKNEQEITAMREGGKRLAEIMGKIGENVGPGINTLELDKLAEELVFRQDGIPAFKGYGKKTGNSFPATICASLNDAVVHGIPSEKIILQEGDILKIDIGMKYQGLFVDMARTFPIGRISNEAKKIISVTEQSFREGIKNMKSGMFLSDYSKAVQKYVENEGFSVVRSLVGHGIGKEMHEDPQIPNYFNKNYWDHKLYAGMTLALEPMVNAGHFKVVLHKDKWMFITKDGSLSAHYENTVLITEKGTEILTLI